MNMQSEGNLDFSFCKREIRTAFFTKWVFFAVAKSTARWEL